MKLKEIPKETFNTIFNLILDLVYMFINIFRRSDNQLRRS